MGPYTTKTEAGGRWIMSNAEEEEPDLKELTFEQKAGLIRRELFTHEGVLNAGGEVEIWDEVSGALGGLDCKYNPADAQRALRLCELFLLPRITTPDFRTLFDDCLRVLRDCGENLEAPENKAVVYTIMRRLRDCLYLFFIARDDPTDRSMYMSAGVEVFENAPAYFCFLWQNARGKRFVTHQRLDTVLQSLDWIGLWDRFGFDLSTIHDPGLIPEMSSEVDAIDTLDLEDKRPWQEGDRALFQAYLADNRRLLPESQYTNQPHIYTWAFEQLVERYGALFPEIKLRPTPWPPCKTVTWMPGQDPFGTDNMLQALVTHLERHFDRRVEAYHDERKVAALLATHPRVGAASAMRVLAPGRTVLSDGNVLDQIMHYGDFLTQRQLAEIAQDPAAARRRRQAKKKKAKAAMKRGAEAIAWQESESKRPPM